MKSVFALVFAVFTSPAYAANGYICANSNWADGYVVMDNPTFQTIDLVKNSVLLASFDRCQNDGAIVSCIMGDRRFGFLAGLEVRLQLNGSIPTKATILAHRNPKEYENPVVVEEEMPCKSNP